MSVAIWIFTFGFADTHPQTGESLASCYVRVPGDVMSSRTLMASVFGNKWSMQYPNEEAAGVERYNMTEIPFPYEEA
jgi:hypothetical protein